MARLPTWEDPTIPLGPLAEDEPETEVVRPRHFQLIPGYYAAMLIHRRGISTKVAFQELHGAMAARHELEACRDVLVWLKAAATAHGGGGLQNGVPIVYHPLAPVHMPPAVYQYLTSKVTSDLPALAIAAANEMTGTLAGALRALTRPGTGGEVDDRGPREVKTVQDVYKETFTTLLRFCNVTSPTDVAPVWARLANCGKSEQHTIITQDMQRMCMARGLATNLYTPIVTTGLKQMITGFMFVGHGVDDLSSGCQPFQVAYSGSTNHMQALAAASIGHQLAQGDNQATLTDYCAPREKEKVKFPRDTMEVAFSLSRFVVLCQTLFQDTGPPNPLVETLWGLAASMQNAAPFVTERYQQMIRLPTVGGGSTLPVSFVPSK